MTLFAIHTNGENGPWGFLHSSKAGIADNAKRFDNTIILKPFLWLDLRFFIKLRNYFIFFCVCRNCVL